MEDQMIYNKIEEIYNSEKGKGFITHLLRSFLPIHRTYKLLSKEDKHKMVDCITGEKLSDADTVLRVTEKHEVHKHMVTKMISDARGEENEDYVNAVKAVKEEIGTMALTCSGSDKLMSHQTLQQLFNFYASEILKGNKHINWIANNERGKETIKWGEKQGFINNSKQKKAVKKAVEGAKMSLGDIDTLRELKEKMEKEEKNGTN